MFQCYFNEEKWDEHIGQGWEMVILDLKDRFELKLNETEQLLFIKKVEENGSKRLISEMEFVVDNASSISDQIAKKVSIIGNYYNVNII